MITNSNYFKLENLFENSQKINLNKLIEVNCLLMLTYYDFHIV